MTSREIDAFVAGSLLGVWQIAPNYFLQLGVSKKGSILSFNIVKSSCIVVSY